RAVADRLGFVYVDTGAMYRAVALAALRRGVALDDPEAMGGVARAVTIAFDVTGTRLLLDGEDVSAAIRTAEVTRNTRYAASAPPVRTELVRRQQELAADRQVVMEGRDITTVVLPHARWKFYLDASVACRARRRQADLAAAGEPADLAVIADEIEARDRSDRERAVGPLRRTDDQIYLDTSDLSPEAVVDRIVTRVRADADASLRTAPRTQMNKVDARNSPSPPGRGPG
ncbi:MAG: (d)CMP kinase, partial [Planctomycetota bacterium]